MYTSSVITQQLAYDRSAELRRHAADRHLAHTVTKPTRSHAERRLRLPAPRWRRSAAVQPA